MRPSVRSSLSKRDLTPASPPPRSRSAERHVDEPRRSSSTFEDDEFNGAIAAPARRRRQDRSLRRSMSDPFDSPIDHDVHHITPEEESKGVAGEVVGPLPRFPISETHNTNCWSEPSASETFKIRGPTYLKTKKKVPSGTYVFPARGADLLLSEHMPRDVAKNPAVFGGLARRVPSFIFNFVFPWGVLVLYFEIPSRFLPHVRAAHGCGPEPDPSALDAMSPAERAVCRFLRGDDEHRNGTLKLIPIIAEGPFVARQMVTGKPAIIGKKLPVRYTYGRADAKRGLAEYLEADLDIGSGSKAAKRIVNVCRRYMSSITVDVGLVIQGNKSDELPEQMLGCVRLHRMDPLKAPALPV